jgi:hypothetical protein
MGPVALVELPDAAHRDDRGERDDQLGHHRGSYASGRLFGKERNQGGWEVRPAEIAPRRR